MADGVKGNKPITQQTQNQSQTEVVNTATGVSKVAPVGYDALKAPSAGSDQPKALTQSPETPNNLSSSAQNLNLNSIYAGTFAPSDFAGYTGLDYNRLSSSSYLSDTKNTITYENMNYHFAQSNGML